LLFRKGDRVIDHLFPRGKRRGDGIEPWRLSSCSRMSSTAIGMRQLLSGSGLHGEPRQVVALGDQQILQEADTDAQVGVVGLEPRGRTGWGGGLVYLAPLMPTR
jgi:hypothetical protein